MTTDLDQRRDRGQLLAERMKIGPDYEATHQLRDGGKIVVRPIRPSDRDELRRGFEHLSATSRYRRFLAIPTLTDEMLDYLVNVDGIDHVALVAIEESPDMKTEKGLGVARFVRLRDEPEVAEGAVTVVDEAQNRGIGTILARTLTEAARERGIKRVRAEVLASNMPVREGLVEAGAKTISATDGTVVYDVPLEPEEAKQNIVSRVLRMAAETMAFVARTFERAATRK